MSAYFVTGTGTGIGKTFTTCALLHAARGKGKEARGYKPIISGWNESEAIAPQPLHPQGGGWEGGATCSASANLGTSEAAAAPLPASPLRGEEQGGPHGQECDIHVQECDSVEIMQASGANQTLEEISPWRFTAPLSPHRAAALEGKTLQLDDIVEWSRARSEGGGLSLIEGVGGVMVPLNETATSLDWMRALGLPVILVTGSYLGTISHTLTAIRVLEQAGLTIAALVMNESAESTVDFAEAQAGLAPFIATIPLRYFQPRVSSWREAREICALLEQL